VTHERVRELAQSDHVSLWGAHQMLDTRLSEELQRAEDALVAEEVGAERDSRNRGALGEGGLLPPSLDTEAMLGVLAAAGISATSGLAYLSSSVPRRRWEVTIEAHPGLLSGILVDAGDFQRSRAALIDAGLHPASLVTLAKKSDLDSEGETAFVVPPSPALYDPTQADEERKTLNERLDSLDHRKAVLAAGMSADRDLRGDLRRFIETCPAGHLDTLVARIGDHDRVLQDHNGRKAELDTEAEEISTYLNLAGREPSSGGCYGNGPRCQLSAGSDELLQLLVVRLTVWHLDAQRERRFGRDGELGDVEVDDAGWWTANGDLAGECPLDTVVGPPGGELFALDPQRFDELGEARVYGVLGGGGAELIEEVTATLLPSDAHARCGALGEVEPHEVAPADRESVWLPDRACCRAS